jgi:hypothetical protein
MSQSTSSTEQDGLSGGEPGGGGRGELCWGEGGGLVGEHGSGGGWARGAGWKGTAAVERACGGIARPVARSHVSIQEI